MKGIEEIARQVKSAQFCEFSEETLAKVIGYLAEKGLFESGAITTLEEIAEKTNLGKATVNRAVRYLTAIGCISTQPIYEKGRRGKKGTLYKWRWWDGENHRT